ncbi:hypothetical protein AAFC00_004634 [Neodothiora populina]
MSYIEESQYSNTESRSTAQQKATAAYNRLFTVFNSSNSADADGDDDNDDNDQDDADKSAKARLSSLALNSYEQSVAMDVVAPSEIPLSFDDIGGLDDIIEELRESVIYPLTMPHLYAGNSSLLSAPSGVLLYGPPGCGKTMLAKALAHESGACFINLHISTLTEKWYGDSNKLVSAVFTLARKLQPTIVFIDEVDAVLSQRRSGEHEASGMVKAEFMTHWDGLTSADSTGEPQRICILGATNRMQDIDEAILRRMPKKFPVRLPDASQRRSIFALTLRDTKLDSNPARFDLDMLVKLSAGMSGSDIKEACRDAAMVPVRESIRSARAQGIAMNRVKPEQVRGLQTDDFFGRRGGVPQLQRAPDVDEWEEERDTTTSDTQSDTTEEVHDFEDAQQSTRL